MGTLITGIITIQDKDENKINTINDLVNNTKQATITDAWGKTRTGWDTWATDLLGNDTPLGDTYIQRPCSNSITIVYQSKRWLEDLGEQIFDKLDLDKVTYIVQATEHAYEVEHRGYTRGEEHHTIDELQISYDDYRNILEVDQERLDLFNICLDDWFSETGPGGRDIVEWIENEEWDKLDLSEYWVRYTITDYYGAATLAEMIESLGEDGHPVKDYYRGDDLDSVDDDTILAELKLIL